jgi:hypothetical protein
MRAPATAGEFVHDVQAPAARAVEVLLDHARNAVRGSRVGDLDPEMVVALQDEDRDASRLPVLPECGRVGVSDGVGDQLAGEQHDAVADVGMICGEDAGQPSARRTDRAAVRHHVVETQHRDGHHPTSAFRNVATA